MQNNHVQQQQTINLINQESEDQHPNTNDQQNLQQNSEQNVEDQLFHVTINQNKQDENQQKGLEPTYGPTDLINEQDQQEDQHQLNLPDVYDNPDDEVDTYVCDKDKEEQEEVIKNDSSSIIVPTINT